MKTKNRTAKAGGLFGVRSAFLRWFLEDGDVVRQRSAGEIRGIASALAIVTAELEDLVGLGTVDDRPPLARVVSDVPHINVQGPFLEIPVRFLRNAVDRGEDDQAGLGCSGHLNLQTV